ncbi:hypothetical protein DRO31_07725 [Candidatus Bathyarchaeota archaeon]|nr:MAG: hypothetical protein DRO31_07725 [Candidatus Bathyarchaeota archaeon]
MLENAEGMYIRMLSRVQVASFIVMGIQIAENGTTKIVLKYLKYYNRIPYNYLDSNRRLVIHYTKICEKMVRYYKSSLSIRAN